MKYKLILITFSILFGFSNCTQNSDDGHSHTTGSAHNHQNPDEGSNMNDEEKLHLTQQQIKTVGLEFGEFSTMKINEYISATGTLGVPPNAYYSVNAKSSGFIRGNNKYVEGDYIKKGTRVANLENPEFILKQQEYMELSAELEYLKKDLARQKSLLKANAGIEKTVQKLESQVRMTEVRLKGSEKYLSYLGIDIDKISSDNIIQQISIYAPASGYLTKINMHNGMYVQPELELMEVVDESHLHLELDVFENDIANLKEEQSISYTIPALGIAKYEGEVHVIGKEFNQGSKTVRIHGHLINKKPRYIKDLFVQAKIWLNDNTVQSLPEESVIKDGTSYYIYVGGDSEESEVYFDPLRVIVGSTENGFSEVSLLQEIPNGKKIVTKGAYYVYAQSQVGSLAHDH
jgi:cobalt-zinc-cadmium efflux system membrane fusion protein